MPGRDRPLTELDMLALQSRSKSRPHKMEWPLKRSWSAVAWCVRHLAHACFLHMPQPLARFLCQRPGASTQLAFPV